MNVPNKLTMARIALVPLFVAALLAELPWLQMVATVLFLIASLTDYLDGYIARSRGLVTDFGKLMDPIADKLLVMAALIGLAAQGSVHPVCVMMLLGREFVVSGFRMLAAGKGVVIAAGPLGKIKTIIQMVGITLVLFPYCREFGIQQVGSMLLWLSAIVSTWSLVDYILRNKEVIAP